MKPETRSELRRRAWRGLLPTLMAIGGVVALLHGLARAGGH